MDKQTIICIDEERSILIALQKQLREALCEILPEKECFEIELAESGEEALEILGDLQAKGEEIPFIICDRILFGKQREELLVKLHEIAPQVLKILLTGETDAKIIGNLINKAAIYRYIAKPWSAKELHGILRETLADYEDQKQLTEQNHFLQNLNATLERKAIERALELTATNQKLQDQIGERNILTEKLRASEQKIRAIFEAMTDIVLIVDEDGNIDIAPTNTRYFEIADKNPLECTVERFLRHDNIQTWLERVRQVVREQETLNLDYSLPVGDRELWFSASISPLPERSAIWVARDITQRKQAEAALQEAKEAAEHANTAKSAFLANMSHELRTPLNAILGFAQLLVNDKTIPSDRREQLQIVKRSGEHLLTLINDILEMSKIEAGRVTLDETDFDLYVLLDSLEAMLQFKATSKDLRLFFEIAEDVPQYVRTDQRKLRQVLINLLGNALKFTESGFVRLSVNNQQLTTTHPQPRPTLNPRPTPQPPPKRGRARGEKPITNNQQPITNNQLYFEIQDTGAGIAIEELELLFEPFVQTETGRQSQEGTGLGLPLSRQFVQLMGGKIGVHSTLGEGSTFFFNIDIGILDAASIQNDRPNRRIIGLADRETVYRILIADDRRESRQLLGNILSPLGFDLREAVNGVDAIAQWQAWKPHLIFMDMRMPVMNGYEATQQIKSHLEGQATAIIALTASVFDRDRAVTLAAGCDDFICKPFQTEDLLEKMATHLGVRYLYEKIPTLSQPKLTQKPSNFSLTSDKLGSLSPKWLHQLYHAAEVADDEQILHLIAELPDSHNAIGKSLAELAKQFRCDRIIELLDAIVF
jgi:PAS domain S-box-containing protein